MRWHHCIQASFSSYSSKSSFISDPQVLTVDTSPLSYTLPFCIFGHPQRHQSPPKDLERHQLQLGKNLRVGSAFTWGMRHSHLCPPAYPGKTGMLEKVFEGPRYTTGIPVVSAPTHALFSEDNHWNFFWKVPLGHRMRWLGGCSLRRLLLLDTEWAFDLGLVS